MRYKMIAVMLITVVVSGCGKFDITHRAAEEALNAQSICIIKDEETREGFLEAVESWMERRNIQYTIIPDNSQVNSCEWCLEYYGRWSWDIAIFLSDSKIRLFHDGNEAGYVSIRVGQWDAYKFEDGEVRIHKMLDMLFGKESYYPLPERQEINIRIGGGS